jgi:pSer/pThr/pTyr-binding forkhead associated (FHA) protein
MPLRLRVIPSAGLGPGDQPGPATERVVEFSDDVDEIRIGRRPDIELSLPFKALSGLHARLIRKKTSTGERGNTWVIEDCESKNGTFIGKDRIAPGRQRLMLAGDEVDLAHVRLVFDGHASSSSGAEGTGTIARRLVNDLFHGSPGANAPTLTVISEGASANTIKLIDRDRPYYVGRASECDLCVNLDELSRKHASFTRMWNGVVVRDLDSKNGIKVNGHEAKVQRLSDGDVVEMGPLELRLMDPEERYLRDLEAPPEKASAHAPSPRLRGMTPVSTAAPPEPAAPRPSFVPKSPAAVAPPHPGPAAAHPGAAPRLSFSKKPPAAASPSPEGRTQLDELHPALATRRPEEMFGPSPEEERPHDEYGFSRPRTSMIFALVVLAVIAVVAFVFLFGGGSSDE